MKNRNEVRTDSNVTATIGHSMDDPRRRLLDSRGIPLSLFMALAMFTACHDYRFSDDVDVDASDALRADAARPGSVATDGGRRGGEGATSPGGPDEDGPEAESRGLATGPLAGAMDGGRNAGQDGAPPAQPDAPDSGPGIPDGGVVREQGVCASVAGDAAVVIECMPDTQEPCGDCGVRRCRADCRWGFCEAFGGPRGCSACGIQTCMPGGSYSACKPSGATQQCGICGVKRCSTGGQWGTCEGTGFTQTCGQCGSQICSTGGVWSPCRGTGQQRACVNNGTQSCGFSGNWDPCVYPK